MGTGESELFSAGVRWQMGWVAHTQPTISPGSTAVHDVRAIGTDPSTASGDGYVTLVQMRCTACLAPGGDGTESDMLLADATVGGTIVVSYWGQGVYALDPAHQGAVLVQLAKRKSRSSWLGGTSLYAILPAGSAYYVDYNGLAVRVCAVGASHAKVAFVASTAGTSRITFFHNRHDDT